MTFRVRNRVFFQTVFALSVLVFGLAAPLAAAQGEVTSPEEFFGFQLGADRKIARWDKIVEYFKLIEGQCGKLKVVDMGPSTMGNPFLAVYITSPENLANLEKYREINASLSSPRGLSPSEVDSLVGEGKAVVCQSMSLHATEIGGSQMAPELAYDLISRQDEETRSILDNVIFILIPSFNPDGQIMVTDWYNKSLGTEYEGSNLPWLYHKYAGHDNNRDGDFINLAESVYVAQIMYRDWPPQAYIDHHHMGSYGARYYVPPYGDPIRPYADPLVWREMSWYGAHIAYKLEENGKYGILNNAQYPGWGHFGWHWITPFHNIAGMLTESASAQLATPIYIHPEQLQGGARQFPEYEAQTTFPHPWPGGWWRLRDIVEQQKISAWACLDLAARNRETVLRNAYLKAKRQSERGAEGTPRAYVIPASQHDPITAVTMINTLLLSGIEIHRADQVMNIEGVMYPAGTFVISLAQPKMGLIRNLLGKTRYPDNEWTRARDGSPLRPYDSAMHVMSEIMGVRVDPVDAVLTEGLSRLKSAVPLSGRVEGDAAHRVLDGKQNASFRAVNLLLDGKVEIQRVDEAAEGLCPGDFILSGGAADLLSEVAGKTGVDFDPLTSVPEKGIHPVKRMRVGMYQRYMGGNMDEGWTRLLLEKFDFPYKSIFDKEIKAGDLNRNYDVIILPDDSPAAIMGEIPERFRRFLGTFPPEYRSGLGALGVEALKAFVKGGGTLVALGEASLFAIDKLGLGIREITERIPSKEFFCPGSTVRAGFDNQHPLAYGMPDDGLVLFWNSPVFEILPGSNNQDYHTIVRYADRDLLRSGWLIGEGHIAGKSAMVSARCGKGEVILVGFRTQNRCQTHGTFKLLFNALIR